MSLRARTTRGVVWSATQNFGTEAIATLVFLVLARIVGPEDFGLVAFATVFTLLLTTIQKAGLGTAIVQRKDLSDEHVQSAFWANILLSLALGGVLALAAPWIAVLVGESRLTPLLQVMAIGCPVAALAVVPEALLTRSMRFRSLAIRATVSGLVGGAVGLTLAFRGFGAWSLVAMQLSTVATGSVILMCSVDWRPRVVFSLGKLRELLGYSVNVLGINLLDFVNGRVDQLLIGSMLGATELGYYAVASRIAKLLVTVLTRTVTSVSLPAFSKLQAEPERLRRALLGGIRLTALVVVPTFAGLALLSERGVLLAFGDEFLPAAPVLAMLAIGSAITPVYFLGTGALLGSGRSKAALKVNAIGSVFAVVGTLIGLGFGAIGVAVAMSVRRLIMTPIVVRELNRFVPIGLWQVLRQLTPAVVGAGVMTGVIVAMGFWITHDPEASALRLGLELGALIAGGAAAYAITILVAFRDDVREVLMNVRQLRKPKAPAKNEQATADRTTENDSTRELPA